MRKLILMLSALEKDEPEYSRKARAIKIAEYLGGEAVEFSEGMYMIIGDNQTQMKYDLHTKKTKLQTQKTQV